MTTEQQKQDRSGAGALHRWITRVLQTIMIIAATIAVYEQQWLNVFIVAAISGMCLLPGLVSRRTTVYIPPEFQLMAIVFVFASLFLGEIGNYYQRFWWWDILLHGSSGLLMGILGFLLVYVLNSDPNVRLRMSPGFIAVFAFAFAMTVGALWEIFEFAMDSLFGMSMQTPMLGDESGLTDTMIDMIVNAIAALIIAVIGYVYMKYESQSFIEKLIEKVIATNPQFFTRKDRNDREEE
jgi:hypothetical protein